MQSVGTRLREAREKKGFSLDEINARTRINSKNLVAIEHDEVKNISSPFIYRSFVRQYADQVELDFRSLAPAVEMLAGNMRQPVLPGQGEHKPVRVAPIQARVKRDFRWLAPATVFVGLVVLGSAGYATWKYDKPLLHAATFRPSPPVKLTAHFVPAHAPAPVPLPASTAPVADTKAVADKIHLVLAATERTWLSVSADGKPAYTGILEPAQRKVLEGQESAKLRTGNAGGVNITFNGKDIGAIGPRGKTRTVVFTKTGYEVVPADGPALLSSSRIGG